MKTATKKITSILFILLGFTPLLFVTFFAIKQQVIRHQMKERMEDQILHTITLTDNQIHWSKKGKEIWVEGKMFDIKSTEHKNGMTIFHGLFDEEETMLKKNFTNGWKKNQSEQNQLLAQIFQCLSSIYFNLPTDISVLSDSQNNLSFFSSPKLLTQFRMILTPPPQV